MKSAITIFAAVAAMLAFVWFFRAAPNQIATPTTNSKPGSMSTPEAQQATIASEQIQNPATETPPNEFKNLEQNTGDIPSTENTQINEPLSITGNQLAVDTPSPQIQTKNPAAIVKANWKNVGTATPEASLQTMFWHGIQEDQPLAREMIHWKKDISLSGLDDLDTIKDHMIKETTTWINSLDNFAIFQSEQKEEGTLEMIVDFESPHGPEARAITFVKEDSVWRPLIHISANSLNWNHTSFEGAP